MNEFPRLGNCFLRDCFVGRGKRRGKLLLRLVGNTSIAEERVGVSKTKGKRNGRQTNDFCFSTVEFDFVLDCGES